MLELKHLHSVRALREGGSLSEAAQRLCMTQSALSHQIKELESRVGAKLFVRKTKPLRFTMAGLRVLELADSVLAQVQQTEAELRRLVGGEAGRLYLALECHSCFNWLMPAIDQYRALWPDVELDFSSGFSFEPLPELQAGELDLVITSTCDQLEGIQYQPLFSYMPMLALAPDHPLADKPVIEPADLANETLISYPVDSERLDVFQLFLGPAGIKPKAIRHVDMTLVMMQLVASGRGVAVLPNWALVDYQAKGYVAVKSLGEQELWQGLYAAVRSDDAESPYIGAFLQIAKDSCFNLLQGIRPLSE
ncbi:LysR family transcriptional regulator [Aliagarivorans taiwanensis]|uniref:LysR family transcriptional regulator n=1 Tax=Aliagarivorans taiwanensis TaxID=561966 RepID=UPI00040C6DA6|nr:LysR family transcriptional regulator [Aliagarivorans taiwanensis]